MKINVKYDVFSYYHQYKSVGIQIRIQSIFCKTRIFKNDFILFKNLIINILVLTFKDFYYT